MTLIKWREEFRTGIPGVDYEHELLIKQINEIFALVDDLTDAGGVVDKLGNIYATISAHFTLEEQMMKKYAYDQYEEHKVDHERLLDEICDITEEFENSSKLNDQKFKKNLNDWFQVHFKTYDSRLHRLANLMEHDKVDKSTLKAMMKNAKNLFFRKTG